MPYAYRSNPNMIVLNGELDFDKTKHPREIYKRLRHAAEEVGGMVTSRGIRHGGTITVYPSFENEYYILFMYEKNEDPSTLKVTHIETWRRTAILELVDLAN